MHKCRHHQPDNLYTLWAPLPLPLCSCLFNTKHVGTFSTSTISLRRMWEIHSLESLMNAEAFWSYPPRRWITLILKWAFGEKEHFSGGVVELVFLLLSSESLSEPEPKLKRHLWIAMLVMWLLHDIAIFAAVQQCGTGERSNNVVPVCVVRIDYLCIFMGG